MAAPEMDPGSPPRFLSIAHKGHCGDRETWQARPLPSRSNPALSLGRDAGRKIASAWFPCRIDGGVGAVGRNVRARGRPSAAGKSAAGAPCREGQKGKEITANGCQNRACAFALSALQILRTQGRMRILLLIIGWCVLLLFCWPLALVALILFPIVWLIALPFRLLGICIDAAFSLIRAILFLPSRLLGSGPK
jgi:hypothetical protein